MYGEQAISEETANNVLSMMTSVVAEGTGKNAKVIGYNVGGKTGTSEDGVNTGKYVTSFIGVAPTDNPQVTILVTLYNPTGQGGHQRWWSCSTSCRKGAKRSYSIFGVRTYRRSRRKSARNFGCYPKFLALF